MSVYRACVESYFDTNGIPILVNVGQWLNKNYPNRNAEIGIDITYHDYTEKKYNALLFSKDRLILDHFIQDFKLQKIKDCYLNQKHYIDSECCIGCNQNITV